MGLTHRQSYLRRHSLQGSQGLNNLTRTSPWATKGILQKVYDRGIGAHKTNPSSVRLKGSFKKDASAPMSARLSKHQWAMARVYAFLEKAENPKKKLDHDLDLVPRNVPRSYPRISKKGSLSKYGYRTALNKAKRRQTLHEAIQRGEDPLRIFRRLNVLYIYNKNRNPGLASKFRGDRDFVKRRFLRWETRTKYGVPITFRYRQGPRVEVVKLDLGKSPREVRALALKEYARKRPPGVSREAWVREAAQNYSTFTTGTRGKR